MIKEIEEQEKQKNNKRKNVYYEINFASVGKFYLFTSNNVKEMLKG